MEFDGGNLLNEGDEFGRGGEMKVARQSGVQSVWVIFLLMVFFWCEFNLFARLLYQRNLGLNFVLHVFPLHFFSFLTHFRFFSLQPWRLSPLVLLLLSCFVLNFLDKQKRARVQTRFPGEYDVSKEVREESSDDFEESRLGAKRHNNEANNVAPIKPNQLIFALMLVESMTEKQPSC